MDFYNDEKNDAENSANDVETKNSEIKKPKKKAVKQPKKKSQSKGQQIFDRLKKKSRRRGL